MCQSNAKMTINSSLITKQTNRQSAHTTNSNINNKFQTVIKKAEYKNKTMQTYSTTSKIDVTVTALSFHIFLLDKFIRMATLLMNKTCYGEVAINDVDSEMNFVTNFKNLKFIRWQGIQQSKCFTQQMSWCSVGMQFQ